MWMQHLQKKKKKNNKKKKKQKKKKKKKRNHKKKKKKKKKQKKKKKKKKKKNQTKKKKGRQISRPSITLRTWRTFHGAAVAVAEYRDGKVLAWAPDADPQAVQETIAGVLGIKKEDVTCHVTLLGRLRTQVETGQVAEALFSPTTRQAGQGCLEPRRRIFTSIFSLRRRDVHESRHWRMASRPRGSGTVYPPIVRL